MKHGFALIGVWVIFQHPQWGSWFFFPSRSNPPSPSRIACCLPLLLRQQKANKTEKQQQEKTHEKQTRRIYSQQKYVNGNRGHQQNTSTPGANQYQQKPSAKQVHNQWLANTGLLRFLAIRNNHQVAANVCTFGACGGLAQTVLLNSRAICNRPQVEESVGTFGTPERLRWQCGQSFWLVYMQLERRDRRCAFTLLSGCVGKVAGLCGYIRADPRAWQACHLLHSPRYGAG